MSVWRRASVLATTLVVFALAGAALAATPTPYPPAAARLNITGDGTFAPGESGSATGIGLTPNRAYILDFAQSPGIVVANATTNNVGVARFDFRVPTTAHAGNARLQARPRVGVGRIANAAITITGAAGGRSILPRTGNDIESYVGLGVLLVALGLGLITYVRYWRRRSRNRTLAPWPTESTRV